MQFTSPQSFLNYAIETYASDIDFNDVISQIEDIKFSDDFNLLIKIKGDKWTGLVDYKIAHFVIKLQKDILNIYNEIYGEHITFRSSREEVENLAIKIKIKPGCTELLIKYAQILPNLAKKLTSKQALFILSLLIVCGFGTVNNTARISAEEAVATKVQDEETKRELIKLNSDLIKYTEKHQDAMRYLANQMDDKDSIILPDSTDELKRRDVMLMFQSELEQEKMQTFEVDDTYELTIINFESGMVTLRKGKIKFQSSTEALSEEKKLYLHELAAKDDVKKVIPKINLQVSATIQNNKVINSFITGIGDKRPNSKSICNAITIKPKDIKDDQYTLLDQHQSSPLSEE